MKIFVLSLASSTERRELVTSAMREYELEFEFIDGIDGRINTSHPYIKRYNPQKFIYNYRRPAAPGELGCYASHMLGWDKCVELDEPIIIFEDDFILNPGAKEAFKTAAECIDEFGFIRLEVTKHKPTFQVAERGAYTLHHFLKVPQCLTSYMISPKVAKALLASSQELVLPVDVLTRNVWIHKQPIYGLSPYTVTGGVQKSIIGKRQKMANRGAITTLICMATRLKNKIFNLIQQIVFIYRHYF